MTPPDGSRSRWRLAAGMAQLLALLAALQTIDLLLVGDYLTGTGQALAALGALTAIPLIIRTTSYLDS